MLDVDGHPFGGLYAAGNVMASALGMTYGGAGGTLGPAMVFGFLSGRHAAQRRRADGTVSASRTGRSALVTGGSSGMGRAIALAFAAEGAAVVVADVDEAGGAADGRARRSRPAAARCSCAPTCRRARTSGRWSSWRCPSTAGSTTASTRPRSRTRRAPLADCEDATFDRMIAVNLRSVFLCMKYEARAMRAQGRGGSIVNIASTNSFRPQPNQAAYTASKHGVLGLTRAGAVDHAGDGIRVNAVCPGAIETPMLLGAIEARGRDRDEVARRLSLFGRFGRPDEIARAVLWLCSEDSSFTTGHALAVDGGYLAR